MSPITAEALERRHMTGGALLPRPASRPFSWLALAKSWLLGHQTGADRSSGATTARGSGAEQSDRPKLGSRVALDRPGHPITPEAPAEARLTLAAIRPGQRAVVLRVGGERVLRRRLVDLGLTAGTEVKVQRVAPLGDPLEVLVKGTHLSLRLQEASTIQVRAHQ